MCIYGLRSRGSGPASSSPASSAILKPKAGNAKPNTPQKCNMRGVIWGILMGSNIGHIECDIRSLDYNSYTLKLDSSLLARAPHVKNPYPAQKVAKILHDLLEASTPHAVWAVAACSYMCFLDRDGYSLRTDAGLTMYDL